MSIKSGKSLQPLSGEAPSKIVLLLHGYGSSAADLIALASAWQYLLPQALFLAPNAPTPSRMGQGYQWWALDAFSSAALAAGAASAAPAIDAFIERKLQQYALRDADLALVGFSQGTMMALHVGLRRKQAVAGIVGYSGSLVGTHKLADQVVSKPPILLIHGSEDSVIPVGALKAAERTLSGLGIQVATHVSSGLGHSVDQAGVRLGAEFLAAHLAGSWQLKVDKVPSLRGRPAFLAAEQQHTFCVRETGWIASYFHRSDRVVEDGERADFPGLSG